jgi:outer membrane protein insertion porin family
LTRVAEIEIRGGTAFDEDRLRKEITLIKGEPYSRSQVRGDTDRLLNLYAHEGYIEAQVQPSIDELPNQGADEQVRVVFNITKEGAKAIVNDIVVNGVTGSADTQETKRKAIIRAIPLYHGRSIACATDITDAERALYVTDAFRQVVISQQPAGETTGGAKKYDVIIDVGEKRPRVIEYGGGYSTIHGALGLMELTNVNFMNRLRTAAIRVRGSQRQQLVRFEFLDPRFARYQKNHSRPSLCRSSICATRHYQVLPLDIDRGTFGIVQRLDEDGNPIDEFGNQTGEPEIDRLTFTAKHNGC